MKKLLFTVTTDLNYDQRMQRICTSLQKAGYVVTLVGRKWPASQPLVPQAYQQHRLRCIFNSGKLFYLEYNLRLFLFLLWRQEDAFCAIDLDTALPVYLKTRIARKPFIYDAHEYFPEMPEVVRRPFVKRIWETLEAFILCRTRFSYTVSNSISRKFKEKYGAQVDVIRNFPYLRGAALGTPGSYILYQGALNEGRGLEALIDAMPQVEMPLVICGMGDIMPQLKKQTEALGLSQKVTFKGYVLPKDLQHITAGAYAGIMLLAPLGESYYYSLANKFFDYVQAGVPQLIPDFPEYQNLNNQFRVGLTCDLNPDNIAASLNQLIQDRDLHRSLQQNCLLARHQWNWEKEEKELLQFYQRLWT